MIEGLQGREDVAGDEERDRRDREPHAFGHDRIGVAAVDEGVDDGRDDAHQMQPEGRLVAGPADAAERAPDAHEVDQARRDGGDQADRDHPGGCLHPEDVGVAGVDDVEDQGSDEEAEGDGVKQVEDDRSQFG